MTGETVVDNEKIYHDAFITFCQCGRRSVRSGCDTIEDTPADMGVTVNAGIVYFDTNQVNVVTSIVSIGSSNPTLDRFDDIVVTTTGVVTVLAGTPSTDRRPPPIDPDNYLILARISIDHAVTQINTANIKDLRTLFTLPPLNTDVTKVLLVGDTMTGTLTSPVLVTDVEKLVYNGRAEGNYLFTKPRTYTSEVLCLSLQTSVAKTTNSSLFSLGTNFFKKTTIRNQGPDTALIVFGTSTVTATLNNSFPILMNDELIIEDHEFAYYSGITKTQNAIVDISNEIGLCSGYPEQDNYSNLVEVLQLSGNAAYAGQFSTLSATTVRDSIIAAYSTSDVYLNTNGVSSTSAILVKLGYTKVFNNTNVARFNLYSTDTSETRILGVGG
jgi:hypothetical protein